jgi:phage terminase large subunit-like protein
MKRNSTYYKELITYCDNIRTGKILSGIYTKKAVKRFIADLDNQKDDGFPYTFIPEKAEEIIRFAETLIIPDMPTEDKKLKLLPWHLFIYYNLYGWVHKEDADRRRFRSGYIEVARKNSKTTSILFPMIIYDFLTTDNAESYFVAADGHQAAKSFKELSYIIKGDKDLKSIINETVYAITYKTSRIAFFSAETAATDSYKNSLSIIDEFHSYQSDKIVSAFRTGGRARKNCLTLIITSAGLDLSGPCYAENEKARKILNGILTDDTYFPIIFAYDDKDDWKDKFFFIKANPSLDIILKRGILENDLNDAVITPSHQADFKAKTCGIWTNDASNWIPAQKWDTDVRNTGMDKNNFKGDPCCGALDLSSVNDFSVFTLCFKKENLFYLYHKFYIPSEQVSEKYRLENINIQKWISEGLVTVIPGPVIDYDYIITDVLEAGKEYGLMEIAYDNWNSAEIIKKLEEQIPDAVLLEYSQSLKSMSNAVKGFERKIYEDRIVDPSPVSKWMIGNSVIKVDTNGNYKPLKEYKSSTKRIDSVITSIMAIDRAEQNDDTNTAAGDFNKILRLFT